MENNQDGRFSVYTHHQSNAYNVASTLGGVAAGPEIHGNLSSGYMYHYHTSNHQTPAHAFFVI